MSVVVLGAMPEEVDSIVEAMDVAERGEAGRCPWWRGALDGHELVVSRSHWGKVAAASTATWLVARFAPSSLLFTGVAGAVDPSLGIGDVVVADGLWQHDMDARPIIERHEIPLLGRARLVPDAVSSARVAAAARDFLDDFRADEAAASVRDRFALEAPRVHVGGIASGDRFVHDAGDAADIRARLPDVLCVEMEGAAVAQVCTAFEVPCAIVRTISDRADDEAAIDFAAFVDTVARRYALGTVRRWLASAGDA